MSTSQDAAKQKKLQTDYLRVRGELNATSSQDEFAKWAKLRRQHDKLLEQLEASSTSPEAFRTLELELTRHYKNREEPGSCSRYIRQVPHGRPTRPHPCTAIHHPLLVRQGSHVLVAVRMVPLLGRVDYQLPEGAAGQCEHCVVAAGLYGNGDVGGRACYGNLGSCRCGSKDRGEGGEEEGGAHQGAGREEGVVDGFRRDNSRSKSTHHHPYIPQQDML